MKVLTPRQKKILQPFSKARYDASDLTCLTLTTVDQVMLEERAASFARRSIKTAAKLAGLKIIASMMDLTTLEGKDTPGKVAYLCRKALQPADATIFFINRLVFTGNLLNCCQYFPGYLDSVTGNMSHFFSNSVSSAPLKVRRFTTTLPSAFTLTTTSPIGADFSRAW